MRRRSELARDVAWTLGGIAVAAPLVILTIRIAEALFRP